MKYVGENSLTKLITLIKNKLDTKANSEDLSLVAASGNYNDLNNLPYTFEIGPAIIDNVTIEGNSTYTLQPTIPLSTELKYLLIVYDDKFIVTPTSIIIEGFPSVVINVYDESIMIKSNSIINNWDDSLPISLYEITSYSVDDNFELILNSNETSFGVSANAHSEGYGTNASGYASHAEGQETTASGDLSHAEGYSTLASGEYQHVQGQYNIEDTSNVYADIIGNGTVETRSNAYTLDWNGNGVFAGKVTAGAGPVNDMDLTTKQYVDEAVANASSIVECTQAEYDALETKDPDTLYIITDDDTANLILDNVPTSGSNNAVKSGGVYNALENKADSIPVTSDDNGKIMKVVDGEWGVGAAPESYKVGDIITTVRTDLGSDWLLCNGDEVDAITYPALGQVIPVRMDRQWGYKSIMPNNVNSISDIKYADGKWVVVDNTGYAYYSTDLKTWNSLGNISYPTTGTNAITSSNTPPDTKIAYYNGNWYAVCSYSGGGVYYQYIYFFKLSGFINPVWTCTYRDSIYGLGSMSQYEITSTGAGVMMGRYSTNTSDQNCTYYIYCTNVDNITAVSYRDHTGSVSPLAVHENYIAYMKGTYLFNGTDPASLPNSMINNDSVTSSEQSCAVKYIKDKWYLFMTGTNRVYYSDSLSSLSNSSSSYTDSFNPSGTSSQVLTMDYIDGEYVAFVKSSIGLEILVSTDLSSWTKTIATGVNSASMYVGSSILTNTSETYLIARYSSEPNKMIVPVALIPTISPTGAYAYIKAQ